jgi:hypothetical protein
MRRAERRSAQTPGPPFASSAGLYGTRQYSRALRIPRAIALAAIAGLIGASAVASFAESYRGLYLWAAHHGLSGGWASPWPAMPGPRCGCAGGG